MHQPSGNIRGEKENIQTYIYLLFWHEHVDALHRTPCEKFVGVIDLLFTL